MADSSMSRRKQDAGLRGFPLELHEGQTVLRQLLLVLEHPAPDLGGGGELREGWPEGLDCERALVLDGLERGECLLPVHGALSRSAAVILGDMHVDQDLGA